MASLKISAAQKKLLTATELTRLKKALEPHTDVARLIRDLRALRAYRQKQRDNLGKQVRAIKVGAQQTRALEAKARTHQKEVLFDEAVKVLKSRLSDLRDQAQAHCDASKPKKPSRTLAPALLERALEVIEKDATSLFESNSLNGKLVDSLGVAEELAELNGLAADIRAYLRRKA